MAMVFRLCLCMVGMVCVWLWLVLVMFCGTVPFWYTGECSILVQFIVGECC